MEHYADSSFFVSLFIGDTNHTTALRFASVHLEKISFNPLRRLEVRNAIRQAVKHGKIPVNERRVGLVERDSAFAQDFLVHHPIEWTNVLRCAEALSVRHTETLGCRAMDILHVAIALESGAKRFLSFDANQRRLASAEGLEVLP